MPTPPPHCFACVVHGPRPVPIAFLHLDEPAHRKAPHSRQMAADSGTVLHTQHLRRTESLYSVSNRSGSVHSRTVQPCANSVAI